MAAKKIPKREPASEPAAALPVAAPPTADGPQVRESASPAETKSAGRGPPVAGIVASAGGLEAFKKFFTAMPADSGIVFVLIPHLDPTRKSLLVELLARYTAMPVVEATDGMAVQANHVYVIPPNRYLTIREGVLRLTGPVEPHAPPTGIDLFLRSLAEDQQENAIGIVLSGTGSYGTLGLKAIKASGGMAMVQDPTTTDYPSMPRHAIAAELADYVLPAGEMAAALLKYVQHFYLNGGPQPETPEEARDPLNQILALILLRTKFNFRSYRPPVLKRRVERRMGLKQIQRFADYLAFLRVHPEECRELAKDMLIGVTGFFRDPEAFQVLEDQVIGPLVEQKGLAAPVRVWVPGCATGEEAYSMAILLLERLARMADVCRPQVFATDVDEDAVAIARQGVYPDSIAADVSAARLQHFFTATPDQHYQVNKRLRETITFAVQDLLLDPPFSKLDLISCRNLLIYLEPEVQQRLVAVFHFALAPGGYLFLGPSETVGRQPDLFEPISRRWRVYRRVGPDRPDLVQFPLAFTGEPRARVQRLVSPGAAVAPVNLARLAQHRLLADYAPAAVLVNSSYQILYFHGVTGRYLEQPSGDATRDLLLMAREGLRNKLRTALRRVLQDQQPVNVRGAQVKHADGYQAVTITVRPVSVPRGPEVFLLVTFEEEQVTPRATGGAVGAREPLVRQLEWDLRSAREDLQKTVEERDSADEKLRASNEEMTTVNEELQLANAELQSSKEELQSLNEELGVANRRLQEKVDELEAANNDIANLFHSTEIAALFLDTGFRVKRFTPAATRLFHLIDTDVGRPISDLVSTFADADLLADAVRVLQDLVARQKEVRGERGSWWIRRILPYRTRDHRIDGVVLTFTNVTRLKQAEVSLAQLNQHLQKQIAERQRLAAIVESSDDAIIGKTLDGTITSWNAGAQRLYGYSAAEALGRSIALLVPPDRPDELPSILERLKQGEHLDHFKTHRVRKDGRKIVVSVTISPVKDAAGVVTGASAIARDITEQERLEGMVRFQAQIAMNMAEGVSLVSAQDAVILYANERFEKLFGYGSGELVGKPVAVLNAAGEKSPEETAAVIIQSLRDTGIWQGDVHNVRKDGTPFWSEAIVSTFEHAEYGTVWLGVLSDITARKQMADSLRDQRERLRAIVDTAADAIISIGEEGIIESVNPAAEKMFGYLPGELVGQNVAVIMPSPYREEHAGYVANYLKTGVPKIIGTHREVRGQRQDGSTFPLDIAISQIDHLRLFTGILRDMSQQKELEREVLEISSLEQRRIGQELHDDVGQELTGLSLMADALTQQLKDTPAVQALAAKVTAGLERVHQQVRLLSRGLVPVDVDPEGLRVALEELAARTGERSGAECTFACTGPVAVANATTATHLLRIAQEAVSNALRHGHAQHVGIGLHADGDTLTLSIRDNGTGIPGPVTEHRGLGIRLMRNRAGLINGTLTIGPADGGGTLVTCILSRRNHG